MNPKLSRNTLSVKLWQALIGVVGAIQSIPVKTTPPPFRLMQMGSLFWQSRALYVAARLGVADVLGGEEKSAEALAGELGVSEDHLFRLLRMLSALDVFEQTGPRSFRNNKTSQPLRDDHPQSVRAMILMHNSPEMTAPWLEPLEAAIRHGGVPFEKVHGGDLFDYMDQNPEFDLLFGRAMDAVEHLTGSEFFDDFNWSAFERVVDVGGSKGSKATAILRRNPHLSALVFDRPQIIEAARAESQQIEAGIRARLRFEGGDMLEYIPPARSGRDLYLFAAVFHGMGDDEALTVLQRLHSAAGDYSPTAVFVDMVMHDMGADATTAAFDMQMLVNTRGRERTEAEWRELLRQGGFTLAGIVPARTFARFIVGRPA